MRCWFAFEGWIVGMGCVLDWTVYQCAGELAGISVIPAAL